MTKTKTESETKEQKQITIDLDKIFNPNPGLLKTYQDAKATQYWIDRDLRPEYLNESRIFAAARASKKPIKHNIFSLHRKQVGSKEYCYFFDLMIAKDYFTNTVDHTRLIGKWERPVITQQYGIDVHSLRSTSQPESGPIGDPVVESIETVYDYEFSKIKDQLVKWKETGIIGDNAIFYVVIENRKYSAPYSWEQWLNLSIQDLQLLGEHGRKFTGLMSAQDPKTLQVLKETIQQEIQKGIQSPSPNPKTT